MLSYVTRHPNTLYWTLQYRLRSGRWVHFFCDHSTGAPIRFDRKVDAEKELQAILHAAQEKKLRVKKKNYRIQLGWDDPYAS